MTALMCTSVDSVLMIGFVPFILGDLIKAGIAAGSDRKWFVGVKPPKDSSLSQKERCYDSFI